RRPDRRRIHAGGLLPRHRPAADPDRGLRQSRGARGPAGDRPAGRGPQALPRRHRRSRGRPDRHRPRRRDRHRAYSVRLAVRGQARAQRPAPETRRGHPRRPQRCNPRRGRRLMSLTGISANRLELLQIADAVAREKSIEKEIVIEAIEEAIQKGAKSRYGADHDSRARIDPKTGASTLTRHAAGVAAGWQPEDEREVANDAAMVGLPDGLRRGPEAEVGKEYGGGRAPCKFGRVQTQMARQVVTHKARESERERQYE